MRAAFRSGRCTAPPKPARSRSTCAPRTPSRKAGSAGRAAMHCEVDLVDADGRPVAPGETGEIRVRGPSVMRGYFRQPEATARAIAGRLVSDRRPRAPGRGRLLLGGRPVQGHDHLRRREHLSRRTRSGARRLPGDPRGRRGRVRRTSAGAKCRSRSSSAGRRMRSTRPVSCALFDGRLARYKRPKRIVFVDDLPKTALGKIQKSVLAARLRGSG